MSEKIIQAVLNITGKKDDETQRLYINALIQEILSYLNRDEITDEMFCSVVSVLVDCLEVAENKCGNIQSLTEGDMSISFLSNSPFFGKLDSFKLIRGLYK